MICVQDYIGLFVNFENDTLHDLRSLLNSWCKEHKLNINKLNIRYCYPKYHYLQNYGLIDQQKELRWLESLSTNVGNFTIGEVPTGSDYSNLCRWLVHNHGVAVFLGKPKGFHEYVYDQLVKDLKIHIVLLEQNIKTREIWVGEPDDKFSGPLQLN